MTSNWSIFFHRQIFQDEYYADMCQLAGLPPVKPYMMEIYRENQRDLKRDHIRFREINFTIIDDEHFVKDKELD